MTFPDEPFFVSSHRPPPSVARTLAFRCEGFSSADLLVLGGFTHAAGLDRIEDDADAHGPGERSGMLVSDPGPLMPSGPDRGPYRLGEIADCATFGSMRFPTASELLEFGIAFRDALVGPIVGLRACAGLRPLEGRFERWYPYLVGDRFGLWPEGTVLPAHAALLLVRS